MSAPSIARDRPRRQPKTQPQPVQEPVPVNTKSISKPHGEDRAKAPHRAFKANLYAEVHAASQANLSQGARTRMKNQITAFVRLVRVSTYHRTLNRTQRTRLADVLQSAKPQSASLKRTTRDFKSDVDNANCTKANRLRDFVGRLGYPLLSVCLLSQLFRDALTVEDDDEANVLSWAEKVELVEERASSLELFAKLRSIDWLHPLNAVDRQLDQVCNVIKLGNNTKSIPKGMTGARMGKAAEGMIERIQVPTSVPLHPNMYSWSRSGQTERREVKYRVTKPLETTYTDHIVNQNKTRPRENIEDYTILRVPDGYTWRGTLQGNDPMYAGMDHDTCEVCGLDRHQVQLESKGVTGNPSVCGCTYENYQASYGHPTQPLVELEDMGRNGVGVRALEDFSHDQVLSKYLGKVYPYSRATGHEGPRYGAPTGCAYILGAYMGMREKRKRSVDDSFDEDETWQPNKKAKKAAKPAKKGVKTAGKPSTKGTKNLKGTAPHSAEQDKASPAGDPIYAIDGAFRGNWTRYINHNCAYNTQFNKVNIGQRKVVLVEANRDIAFGEEITIDYGSDYFIEQEIACQCGVETCRLWSEQRNRKENKTGTKNTITLGEAFSQGKKMIPKWARGVDGLPIPVKGAKAGAQEKAAERNQVAKKRGRANSATKATVTASAEAATPTKATRAGKQTGAKAKGTTSQASKSSRRRRAAKQAAMKTGPLAAKNRAKVAASEGPAKKTALEPKGKVVAANGARGRNRV